MTIFNVLTLFGGLAMFLYGMRLMGDGLKQSSSGTLKMALEHVTNNPVKAFLLGLVITAVIQSSTATIVITSGLVGAGIMTLRQSLGIIVGANVGTTVTGQIIRLLDLDAASGSILQFLKPSSLAPIALIIGMVLIMGVNAQKARTIGNIAVGFGILFSGLLNMTGAVDVIGKSALVEQLFRGLGENPLLGYLTGAGVAFVLQSSSATIGILQAFSASGLLTFKAIYAVIVGIYLGDCVTTAIVCSIGAAPEAKRVGIVNILFNLSETVLVLVVVQIVHRLGLIDRLWNAEVNSTIIANTNTIFNLTCAILLFPMLGVYEKMSYRLIKDAPKEENPYKDKLDGLNPVFMNTPALALRGCYDALTAMLGIAHRGIESSMALLEHYDEGAFARIMSEEDHLDYITDRVSTYIVELSSHLTAEEHISIVDEYYKVVTEFERLGDHAVNIAETAKDMSGRGVHFSREACGELKVIRDLILRVLDNTETAFEKRNLEAAYHIEALEEVVDDMVDALKAAHFARMRTGSCSIDADVNFLNLLSDLERISDVCTNVGEAVILRARPEFGGEAHAFSAEIKSGHNEQFNRDYEAAHKEFFDRLNPEKRTGQMQESVI